MPLSRARITAFLAAFLIIASTAWASADGPDCWNVKGVASNDTLNIRAKPSSKAAVVGTIPPDAKSLGNVDDSPDSDMTPPAHPGWCKIKYKNVTGWVACKFLETGDQCE